MLKVRRRIKMVFVGCLASLLLFVSGAGGVALWGVLNDLAEQVFAVSLLLLGTMAGILAVVAAMTSSFEWGALGLRLLPWIMSLFLARFD